MYKALPLPLIVVGTGRCGTGFVSRYLTSAGLPCGHEALFSTGGLRQARINRLYRTDLAGDSSWLAVPFLDSDLLRDAFMVHLVRHPRKALASMLKLRRHMRPGIIGTYTGFSRQFLPDTSGLDLYDELVTRYVYWTHLIEAASYAHDYVTFHIEWEPTKLLEVLAVNGLLELEDVNGRVLFSDSKYNTKIDDPCDFEIERVDSELRDDLLELCERYGYDWHACD